MISMLGGRILSVLIGCISELTQFERDVPKYCVLFGRRCLDDMDVEISDPSP